MDDNRNLPRCFMSAAVVLQQKALGDTTGL